MIGVDRKHFLIICSSSTMFAQLSVRTFLFAAIQRCGFHYIILVQYIQYWANIFKSIFSEVTSIYCWLHHWHDSRVVALLITKSFSNITDAILMLKANRLLSVSIKRSCCWGKKFFFIVKKQIKLCFYSSLTSSDNVYIKFVLFRPSHDVNAINIDCE